MWGIIMRGLLVGIFVLNLIGCAPVGTKPFEADNGSQNLASSEPTPPPTPVPTVSPQPTVTPAPSSSPAVTPTMTPTPTVSPKPTITPTVTPTATPTATPKPTITPGPTPAPTGYQFPANPVGTSSTAIRTVATFNNVSLYYKP